MYSNSNKSVVVVENFIGQCDQGVDNESLIFASTRDLKLNYFRIECAMFVLSLRTEQDWIY